MNTMNSTDTEIADKKALDETTEVAATVEEATTADAETEQPETAPEATPATA